MSKHLTVTGTPFGGDPSQVSPSPLLESPGPPGHSSELGKTSSLERPSRSPQRQEPRDSSSLIINKGNLRIIFLLNLIYYVVLRRKTKSLLNWHSVEMGHLVENDHLVKMAIQLKMAIQQKRAIQLKNGHSVKKWPFS